MPTRWKQRLALLLCLSIFLCLVGCHKDNPKIQDAVPDWENPYTDLTEDMWVYPYVAKLSEAGIITGEGEFRPDEPVTGAELAAYLQNFADAFKITGWSLDGSEETLTRGQICVILSQFADGKLSLAQQHEPKAFPEALSFSTEVQNAVTACEAAGIITASNGNLRLNDEATRAQCVVMLCTLLTNSESGGETLVSFENGAYTALYAAFVDELVHVPECDPVDASYFDDAVFIGDSVSLRLQYYCSSNNALGDTTFLCSGSLSATNALWNISSESVHPSYQGEKMLIEDGVAACGAKKAYIMLGMNNISFGIENATADMVTLIDRILEKSPDVSILVQAVTPMTSASTIRSKSLNNDLIDQYNERMREICQEHGWYFLDVNTQFKDENNQLVRAYCSDADKMGIHFTTAAAEIWVDYLKTHVPTALTEKETNVDKELPKE